VTQWRSYRVCKACSARGPIAVGGGVGQRTLCGGRGVEGFWNACTRARSNLATPLVTCSVRVIVEWVGLLPIMTCMRVNVVNTLCVVLLELSPSFVCQSNQMKSHFHSARLLYFVLWLDMWQMSCTVQLHQTEVQFV